MLTGPSGPSDGPHPPPLERPSALSPRADSGSNRRARRQYGSVVPVDSSIRTTPGSSVTSENDIMDEWSAQQHRVNYWRASALVAVAIAVLLWVASAGAVWAISARIIGGRQDGVAPGDRAFLTWAPVTTFFLVPVILFFAGSVVVPWRRASSGWLVLSLGVGASTTAIAVGSLFLLAW
jgi:hypothetical protein